MKKILLIAVAALLLAGCDFVMTKQVSDYVGAKAPAALETADAATVAVENAIGKPIISRESAATGESVAGKIETVARVGKGGAETLTNFLPEDKKPYGQLATGILGTLTILASGAAEWFRRRKNSTAKAAVMAAEILPNGGKALAAAAAAQGASKDIQAAYEASLSAGVITGASASGNANSAPSSGT